MKKDEAIALWGPGKRSVCIKRMAKALELTRTALYMWPEELPLDQADRVLGARWRAELLRRVQKKVSAMKAEEAGE